LEKIKGNDIMPNNIDNLLSNIKNRSGLANPNRFKISITPLSGLDLNDHRDLDLYCESTSIPGRQILTADYQVNRHSEKKPNGYSNEDINLTFNLTNDYYIRDIFNKWTNFIINRDTYSAGFRKDYATDILISQLDKNDRVVYEAKLIDAYPVTVQNIELSHTSTDSVSKLNVTMTYYDFEEINRPSYVDSAPKTETPVGKGVKRRTQPTIITDRNDLRSSETQPRPTGIDRTPSGNVTPGRGIQPRPVISVGRVLRRLGL
jgi:hypothetical protein